MLLVEFRRAGDRVSHVKNIEVMFTCREKLNSFCFSNVKFSTLDSFDGFFLPFLLMFKITSCWMLMKERCCVC